MHATTYIQVFIVHGIVLHCCLKMQCCQEELEEQRNIHSTRTYGIVKASSIYHVMRRQGTIRRINAIEYVIWKCIWGNPDDNAMHGHVYVWVVGKWWYWVNVPRTCEVVRVMRAVMSPHTIPMLNPPKLLAKKEANPKAICWPLMCSIVEKATIIVYNTTVTASVWQNW